MSDLPIAIVGHGYALPEKRRSNDDPVFDWIKDHDPAGKDLFTGYVERRVLAEAETLLDIMVPAAGRGLGRAGLPVEEVGLLTGYASVSEYITPNALAAVHRELKLPSSCWCLPVADDFTNALSGLLVAHALVEAGHARYGVIVTGCNWSRYSNYHKPQAVSSADGAGAWVVGPSSDPTHFRLVDAMTTVQPETYGAMYMQPDRLCDVTDQVAFSSPWYHINRTGIKEFETFGEDAPPRVVQRLLRKHGIAPAHITLFTHQASKVLLDVWLDRIEPGQFLDSLAQLANMTLASIPVNFAIEYDQIANDHVVLVGVGPQFQATALLLERG